MLALGLMQRGAGLVAITLLARILDQRGLGAYALAQSTSQTFYGFARVGADAGLHIHIANTNFPEGKAKVEALLGEGLAIFLGIAAAGTAIILLLADTIASNLFAAPELAPFVVAGAVFFVSQAASQYCYSTFAGLNAFTPYARLTTITSLLVPTLGVSGGLAFGAIGAVWGAAGMSLLAALALAVLLWRELALRGLRVRLMLPSRQAAAMLSVGFPLYASGLFLIPVEFFNSGLLSQVAGVAALGELRVTQSLTSVASMIPVAMAGPITSHLAAKLDTDNGPEPALFQLKAIWVLSLCIAIPLAAIWPVAVAIVFGGAYQQAQSVGVLALAGFIPMMLLTVLTGALLAIRRSMPLFAIGGLQALILATCAWVLIASQGLAGLFAAQAAGMLVAALASALALARQFDAPFFRTWMVPLSLLTVIVTGLLFADVVFTETLPARLAIAFGLMCLLIVVVLVFVVTRDDRARISDLATAAGRRALRSVAPASTKGAPDCN